MLFSSITFLYYFLPITMGLYVVAPKRWRNAILFLASFLFYFWGEPTYCLLMLVSILAGYLGGLAVWRTQNLKEEIRRLVLFIAVAIPLSFLVVFKYMDFGISSLNLVLGTKIPLVKLALPIGISFYTFQIISYLADVYRKETPVEKNIINMGAYVAMFPQLIAGPIVRFSSIQRELKERTLSTDQMAKGIGRFVTGLAKKVLLADLLGEFVLAMDGASGSNTLFLWIVALAYALQIYFDFAGYSDMAIGLGLMLGFHFPENFDYPYRAKSITEFWRRWHMTLGGWFRDYVYIPLGGSRVSVSKWIRNVFVVWALSGLWHGASWNFVVWGLYFGVILVLEKLFLKKWLEKLPALLQHLYAIVLVVISFVIFRLENFTEAGSYLAGMFGFGLTAAEEGAGMSLGSYQIRNYGFLIVVAFVIATGIPKQLWDRIKEQKWGAVFEKAVTPVVYLILLLVVTGFLIQSSVHPFLYFRF